MKRRPLVYRSIWIYYFKYKDTVVFTVSTFLFITLVSLILFWKVILPQIQNWFSIQNEVSATKERIKNIRGNIAFLSSLNSADLEKYFATSVAAYPPEKDYFGILTAVSSTAIETNVSLEDYSFAVGELNAESDTEFIPIELSIQLNNVLPEAKIFVKSIQQKIPLSQIDSVISSEKTTSIIMSFPFKTFAKIKYADSKPIEDLSPLDKELLNELSAWKPIE